MIQSSHTSANAGEGLPFGKIFDALPQMALILSPGLVIQAANEAFLRKPI